MSSYSLAGSSKRHTTKRLERCNLLTKVTPLFFLVARLFVSCFQASNFLEAVLTAFGGCCSSWVVAAIVVADIAAVVDVVVVVCVVLLLIWYIFFCRRRQTRHLRLHGNRANPQCQQ